MALPDALRRLFGAAETKTSLLGLADYQLADSGLEKVLDDGTLLSTFRDDPWPYICANLIGSQASQAVLQAGTVTPEGSFAAVGADHPLQSLLDHPASLMDGGEWLHLLLLYMELAGHAPIEVVRPRAGGRRITTAGRAGFELNLISPASWRIVANKDGSIRGYLYQAQTGDVRWKPDEMIYLRWPNPGDRYYGQGRLAAVRQAVMAEEYAAQRDKRFEQRLGVPPGILSVEAPIGTPQAEELQRRWEQAVGGYRQAGKIAVLGSKTTYQAVTTSARDAQWIEHRRWRVQEMAAGFGIPLVLLLMSEATYANAKEARNELWEGNLGPKLDRVARMLGHRLLPLLTDEPLVLRFDYSGIAALNENRSEVAKEAVQWAQTGAVTVGEVRGRLGLPPFGDRRDEMILMPADLAAVGPVPIVTTGEMSPAPAPPTRSGKARREPRDRVTLLTPVREAWQRDLASFFVAQRAALTELHKAEPSDLLARAAEIIAQVRFEVRLERISRSPIEVSLTLGAESAAGVLAVPASFAVPASAAALAAVDAQLVQLGQAVQGTTTADVSRTIAAALERGASNAEMRADLDALFRDYEDWRLDRISRTETARAYTVGSAGQYRSAGVRYVDIVDGDGDEPCAAANGQRWTVEDWESNPQAHPNCTRDGLPVVEEAALGDEEPPVSI